MIIMKWFMPVVLVLLPILVFAQDNMKDNPGPNISISLDSRYSKSLTDAGSAKNCLVQRPNSSSLENL